jgi:UDP-N-acetylmuramate dehydrogenase
MFGARLPHPAGSTLTAMIIEEQVPLAPLTTFRIGGPARYFARAQSVQEVKEVLSFAKERTLQVLILGGGSNVLISDEGFDGVVLKLELKGVLREGETLIAAAGEEWDALVERAIMEGLWGIENLSGIPGSVGASPVQNIGAYGTELKDVLDWVEVLDRESGTVVKLTKRECGFGYRTSTFKRGHGRYVVLRVALRLHKNGTPNTTYKDLVDIVGSTLPQIRQKVLAVRADKFPDLSKEGTAGSFFLNPVISKKQVAQLSARYPGMPQYPTEGGIKLSLAWLLDRVLQVKGMHEGGARLFEKQPLVIAAERDSKAYEVRILAQKIKNLVKEKLQIEIEEEVRIVS